MRQTGGTALGETSTRSRPRSRAIFNASKGGKMPSCVPLSSITRTSRARILSLMRINCLAERLSMGFLQNTWKSHVATQYIVADSVFDAVPRYPFALPPVRAARIPGMVFCLVDSEDGPAGSEREPGFRRFGNSVIKQSPQRSIFSRKGTESPGIAYETAHIAGR